MRAFLVIAAATGAVLSTAAPASVRKAPPVRRVELITMEARPGPPDATAVAGPTTDLAAPALPDAFRVHDLSRRYVEYRMAQEFTAAAPPPAQPAQVAPIQATFVAATSSIQVPAWMRAAYASVSAVPYTPGCSPLPYRPAGFLGRTAEARRAAYYGMMSAIACEQGIPTGLFDAMIIRESGYNPLAISPKNAFGLAQLMPDTAAMLGVNRFDMTQNMRGGARFLRQQLDRFGQVHLALAAYNAGPGRVRNGLVPRIRETEDYVSGILANWSRLNGFAPPPGGTVAPIYGARLASISSF